MTFSLRETFHRARIGMGAFDFGRVLTGTGGGIFSKNREFYSICEGFMVVLAAHGHVTLITADLDLFTFLQAFAIGADA